jgi:hypothetical protein
MLDVPDRLGDGLGDDEDVARRTPYDRVAHRAEHETPERPSAAPADDHQVRTEFLRGLDERDRRLADRLEVRR